MKEILNQLVAGNDLDHSEMASAMDMIMSGNSTQAQSSAFLTALRIKEETVDEVAGGAASMRQHATFIDAGARSVIDTCGTGGDGGETFNISTASALVAAGAGACVAKHGNRAVSSRCGSADVLQEIGVNIEAPAEVMEQCIQEHGIGFLFAPTMHPAMKNVAGIRRELGFRTVFNMLGPLTNPAGATGQLLGVFDDRLTETFAYALQKLGCRRAMVVHGSDGMDEITINGATRISELRDGAVRTYRLTPEMLLGELGDPAELKGGDSKENSRILKNVLNGEKGACRQIVVLNSAAAIMVAELADRLEDAIIMAEKSIDSGAAREKLDVLVEFSSS